MLIILYTFILTLKTCPYYSRYLYLPLYKQARRQRLSLLSENASNTRTHNLTPLEKNVFTYYCDICHVQILLWYKRFIYFRYTHSVWNKGRLLFDRLDIDISFTLEMYTPSRSYIYAGTCVSIFKRRDPIMRHCSRSRLKMWTDYSCVHVLSMSDFQRFVHMIFSTTYSTYVIAQWYIHW